MVKIINIDFMIGICELVYDGYLYILDSVKRLYLLYKYVMLYRRYISNDKEEEFY